MLTPITRQELLARLEANPEVVVVEALGRPFYDDAHLPGALHLPPDRVERDAARLVPDLDAEVVVYCSNTCEMALETGRRLVALGYRHVRHYAGGKEDWVEAGLPVERADPPAAR